MFAKLPQWRKDNGELTKKIKVVLYTRNKSQNLVRILSGLFDENNCHQMLKFEFIIETFIKNELLEFLQYYEYDKILVKKVNVT